MNPLESNMITGTMGELLVQIRLFQYDVQSAPPLKDSGNDLIAIRGPVFRAIQVRTTGATDGRWKIPKNKEYHILALVRLCGKDNEYHLDQSEIYLLSKQAVDEGTVDYNNLEASIVSRELVDEFFPPTQ
jgi:hypothetical protein